ncbi:MAG: hypothetical protein FJW66_03980 [Actinobacteria bacterium]|nr:hypothetical protein [Actinomycetota bacterium]
MARRVYVREIYFYVICLVSIILFIVGIVNLVDSSVNFVKPTTYMTRANILPAYKDQYEGMSQEEIDRLISEEIQAQESIEKTNALKGLIRGALLVVIAIPLFSFHWIKAQAMWRLNLEND